MAQMFARTWNLGHSLWGAVARFLGHHRLEDLPFALRHRLWPLLPHLPAHAALARSFRRPGLIELRQRHPGIEYKYLRTYLASDLSTADKLLCLHHHHRAMQECMGADFFRLYDTPLPLWQCEVEQRRYRIALSYPVSLSGTPDRHDQEGDLSLLLYSDQGLLGKLNFSLVPGRVFGQNLPELMFIGCLQCNAGAREALRRTGADLQRASAQQLLVAVAEGVAAAFKLQHLAAVGTRRQLCSGDQDFHCDYDSLWAELGGVAAGDGIFLLALDRQPRPLAEIKKIYRSRVARKRALLASIAVQAKGALQQALQRAK